MNLNKRFQYLREEIKTESRSSIDGNPKALLDVEFVRAKRGVAKAFDAQLLMINPLVIYRKVTEQQLVSKKLLGLLGGGTGYLNVLNDHTSLYDGGFEPDRLGPAIGSRSASLVKDLTTEDKNNALVQSIDETKDLLRKTLLASSWARSQAEPNEFNPLMDNTDYLMVDFEEMGIDGYPDSDSEMVAKKNEPGPTM